MKSTTATTTAAKLSTFRSKQKHMCFLGGKVFALVKAYSVFGFIWSMFSRQNIKRFSFHVPRYCLCLLISVVGTPPWQGYKNLQENNKLKHTTLQNLALYSAYCVIQKHRNVKQGKTDFNNFVEEIFSWGAYTLCSKNTTAKGCRI